MKTAYKKPRRWAPRIWMGIHFTGWFRLIIHNHLSFSLDKIYIAVLDTIFSIINSLLLGYKSLRYGPKIAKFKIAQPPLFIIGHWRTGTTLLQSLLGLNPNFIFPTYYQCFAPNHFLITEKSFPKALNFLMPTHRPMDNMPAGWDLPQEDEFALCNLGIPSPYWTIAFPNRPPQFTEYFTLEDLNKKDLDKWKKAWTHFLKEIASTHPNKRIILKSPTHSFRIKLILDLFPEAQFIQLIRDPYVIFPSTIHLWKSLYRAHGLQNPNFIGLEEMVFNTFISLYQKLAEDRPLVSPQNFSELRYEDLVTDPCTQLNYLYEHLNLGRFELIRPQIENYFKKHSDYQTNRYALTPEIRNKITHHWGPIIKKMGYPLQ